MISTCRASCLISSHIHGDAAARISTGKSMPDDILQHFADGNDHIKIAPAPSGLGQVAAQRSALARRFSGRAAKVTGFGSHIHRHDRSSPAAVTTSKRRIVMCFQPAGFEQAHHGVDTVAGAVGLDPRQQTWQAR